LRYLLPFLVGHTVFEVEGMLGHKERQLGTFHLTKRQAGEIFRGNSKELLKLCAKAAAVDIVKQIITGIKKHG